MLANHKVAECEELWGMYFFPRDDLKTLFHFLFMSSDVKHNVQHREIKYTSFLNVRIIQSSSMLNAFQSIFFFKYKIMLIHLFIHLFEGTFHKCILFFKSNLKKVANKINEDFINGLIKKIQISK